MLSRVYVDSNVGITFFSNGSINTGLVEPLPSIYSALAEWKDTPDVQLIVSAGLYTLGDLSFTKENEFELRWSTPPTLFGTYQQQESE